MLMSGTELVSCDGAPCSPLDARGDSPDCPTLYIPTLDELCTDTLPPGAEALLPYRHERALQWSRECRRRFPAGAPTWTPQKGDLVVDPETGSEFIFLRTHWVLLEGLGVSNPILGGGCTGADTPTVFDAALIDPSPRLVHALLAEGDNFALAAALGIPEIRESVDRLARAVLAGRKAGYQRVQTCVPATQNPPATQNLPATQSPPATQNLPATQSPPATQTRPNTPIGTQTVVGFVDRDDGHGGLTGGVEKWQEHGFSEADHLRGQEVRDARETAGLGLRDAAQRLGVSALHLSECERGCRSFVDHAAALALLRGAP